MSGCATLSGVAVLENARSDGGQSVLFDAHFFFYPDPSSGYSNLALLRYYNEENMMFDPDEPKTYMVWVHIACMEDFCEQVRLGDGMEIKDYVLAGDIFKMIPVNGIDPRISPFLSVCGVVASYDRSAEDKQIEVCPNVYTYVLSPKKDDKTKGKGKDKDTDDNSNKSPAKPAGTQRFPVSFMVPNTPRWSGDRVPKVCLGTYICCEGFLLSVRRRPSDGMTDHFKAELEKVTFLGRPFTPPTNRKPMLPADTPSPATPPNKRLRFSYADTTPTPASRKRQMDENGAGPSSA